RGGCAAYRRRREGADRPGRQPALQRLGARAAAPAACGAEPHERTRHGAGRGRAPPRGGSRFAGLRLTERQSRLVRRLVDRRHHQPAGVLAGTERRLGARRLPPRRAARNGCRTTCHLRPRRSEEHTSELQSRENLVCRLLLEKKKKKTTKTE